MSLFDMREIRELQQLSMRVFENTSSCEAFDLPNVL